MDETSNAAAAETGPEPEPAATCMPCMIDTATTRPSANDPGPHADVPRFTSIASAEEQGPGVQIGLLCNLLSSQKRHRKDEETKEVRATHHFHVQDAERQERCWTTRIEKPHLLRVGRKAIQHGQRVVLFGCFTETGEFRVSDIRPMTRPTTMLGVTKKELREIDRELDLLWAKPNGLLDELLKEVRQVCGVSESFLSKPFRLAELMMVLQALSCGQVEKGLNSKLSILLTSGPGTGKTLVGSYGQIFLPFSGIVQPGLVSPVGLGAVVRVTKGGQYAVEPGAAVLASGGSLLFDDMHRVDQRHMNLLQAIFMTVMEKGLIKSTKAAQAEMEANCGLVMTANRFSLRNGKLLLRNEDYGPGEKGKDLVAPFDVLSRTDLVLYMGQGDDAVRSAMQIVCMPPRAEFDPEDDEDQESRPDLSPHEARIRRLQLLIARAKERIPTVSVGKVGEEAQDTMLVLGVVMREYTAKITGQSQESYDGDMLIRRMANTVRKILGALGRLHGRSYSTKEDLDLVWDLLTPKLEVVRWLCGEDDRIRPLGTRAEQLKLALWASEQRFQKMMQMFGGQSKSAEELAKALGCAEVAVLRDLSRRRIEPEGHLFPIPNSWDWVPDPERDNALDPEVVKPVVVPAAEVAGLPPEKLRYEGPDKLPRPPAEAREAVEAVRNVDAGMTVEWLMKLVLEEEAGIGYDPQTVVGIVSSTLQEAAEERGEDITMPAWHLRRWLLDGEWATRAERAMGFYAEGMGLPGQWTMPDRLEHMIRMVGAYEDAKGPLPERVKQAVVSAYNRLIFYREKRLELEKRELEQELKRQQRGQRRMN